VLPAGFEPAAHGLGRDRVTAVELLPSVTQVLVRPRQSSHFALRYRTWIGRGVARYWLGTWPVQPPGSTRLAGRLPGSPGSFLDVVCAHGRPTSLVPLGHERGRMRLQLRLGGSSSYQLPKIRAC
jgi:hypothetical protein